MYSIQIGLIVGVTWGQGDAKLSSSNAGLQTACGFSSVAPPKDVYVPTTRRQSSTANRGRPQRYANKTQFLPSHWKLGLFVPQDERHDNALLSCFLFFHQGTHHLWSMPLLSYQDVTYHFRVSQSVSPLSQGFRPHGPDLLLICSIIIWFDLIFCLCLFFSFLSICFSLRVKWAVPRPEKPHRTPTTTSSSRADVCDREEEDEDEEDVVILFCGLIFTLL